MHSIRAFIAVELNQDIKSELSRIQSILKMSDADVKWVAPSNLHITIKFLGQIKEGKELKISQIMRDSSSSIKPFTMAIENLGVFPKINYPRVVWVDTASEEDKLKGLAKTIETAMVSLKFPKQKRGFKSHITLGRVRSNRNRDELIELIQTTKVNRKEMLIKSLTLFKSTLSSSGPHYEQLCVINLS